MYKVDENPVCRYPEEGSFCEEKGFWVIARLRSRREKMLAQFLYENKVPYYLPMYLKRSTRKDNGKIRKSLLPLFPGYIAVSYKERSKELIFKGDHVFRLIHVSNQDRLIKEMNTIHKILEEDVQLQVQMGFVPGRKVVVRSGPLRGIEGVIEKKDKQHFLHISMVMFGRSLTIKLDSADINPHKSPSMVDWVASR